MPAPNEYVPPISMDSGNSSIVSERRGGLGGFVRYGVPVGAVLFAGWMVYSAMQPNVQVDPTSGTGEDFRPPAVPDLLTENPQPQRDPGVITIPEAPPPAPPPPLPAQPPATVALPPPVDPPAPPPAEPAPAAQDTPPPTVVDDSEARRLAELERQRLAEEERRRWERLRAKQIVADGATSGSASDMPGGDPVPLKGEDPDAAGQSGGGEEADPQRRFLQTQSNAGFDVASASKNERIDALVPQGTMIRAVLETAIQSDLAGMVRAVTSEDVWSFDGRRVLIPSGSRLIGEYQSGIATGQTRVFIVWTRMLRSDGVSVQLGSIGTDELGRTGMTGIVDNHYFKKFGSAILLSVVGGATQFLANYGQTDSSSSSEDEENEDGQSAREIAAQQISQSLNNLAEEALKDNLQIKPTIHVDQGSRIIVFVRRDLDFSSLYPDPVKEALKELRRERAGLPK